MVELISIAGQAEFRPGGQLTFLFFSFLFFAVTTQPPNAKGLFMNKLCIWSSDLGCNARRKACRAVWPLQQQVQGMMAVMAVMQARIRQLEG